MPSEFRWISYDMMYNMCVSVGVGERGCMKNKFLNRETKRNSIIGRQGATIKCTINHIIIMLYTNDILYTYNTVQYNIIIFIAYISC